MNLREGIVIEFKDKKRISSVLCLKVETKNVRVVNEANKEFNLPINKIAHITDHVLSLSKPRFNLIEDLNSLINKIENKTVEISLADLWDLLKEEPEEKYDLKQLTDFYFSSGDNSDDRSIMLRALTEDSIYFDIKNDGFYSPKPEKIVEQIIQQKKLEEVKLKQRENAINWIKSVWSGKKEIEKPEGIDKNIELLKEVAVFDNRSDKYNDVVSFLSDAGIITGNIQDTLISLLTKLKIFDPDENLLLLEYKIQSAFSNNAIDETEQDTIDIEKELAVRTDLRSTYTITIDDEETKDIDDGISFIETSDGFQIMIHIADPAHFIAQGSLLDKEAHSRATTIYLPDRKIEMLPFNLSENLASLVEGQDRLALTLIVNFDLNNEITKYEIKESIIHVDKRLSYKDADLLCQTESFYLKLSNIAEILKQKRIQNGAIVFNFPELKIKVTEDKQIFLSKYKQNSPSQFLVSELMILANYLVAEYLNTNKVPSIYRYQDEPSEIIEFNEKEKQMVQMYKQRRLMKKSEVSTIPSEHHGLGIKFYTQMTSPIRRYSDLVIHRQLKAFLKTGKGFYNEEEVKEIINFTEHSLAVSNIIQRSTNRYWLCKFLKGFIGYKTPALVLDINDDKYHVQLTDFMLELPLNKEFSYKLEVGQEIEVVIKDAQVRRGFISIKYLKEPNENIKKIELENNLS